METGSTHKDEVTLVVVRNVLVPLALHEATWQPTKGGNTRCVRRDVHLDARKGTIVAVRETLPAGAHHGKAAEIIDGTNKLLLPGFLNGHTHSGEMYNRGAIPPLPLELWLGYLWDYSPQEPARYYLSALLTAVEGLLTGVTCVLDMPSILAAKGREFECLEAICQAYRDVGIRAFVCPLINDLPIETSVALGCGLRSNPAADKRDPKTTDELIAFMERAVEKLHRPDDGIEIGVGPSGIQLCSDELFVRCKELSEKHNLIRHVHLLETKNQKKLAFEKYGVSAVKHLKELGYLNGRTTCAHSIWLDPEDIELLQTTGASPVHNPLSNLRLGSGIAPVLKYLRSNINVCFGCDGAASNDSQDMLEAIKIGSILHNITDAEYLHWITPDQAFRMAALGGASAVGLQEKTGLIAEGRSADLVLYDLSNSLSILPRTDILGLLLLGRPNNIVTDVWVRGRRIVKGGRVVTIDEEKLKRDLFNSSHWTSLPSDSTTRDALEQQYRAVAIEKERKQDEQVANANLWMWSDGLRQARRLYAPRARREGGKDSG